jgi:protein-tyrosine phosphatase
MAEFIFRDMLKTAGLDHRISVASSATSTEEIWNGIGNPVYPPAREELAKHGLSCEGKRAVQLQKSDYDKYDLFLVMDENNLRNIFRIFPADPQGKVRKLLDYVGGGDVADPWFTEQFDVTYGDLLRGCKALLEDLIQNGIENEV